MSENTLEMAIIERLSHKIATQDVTIIELELRLEQAIHTAQALAKENEKLKGADKNGDTRGPESTAEKSTGTAKEGRVNESRHAN